jgi:Phytanoyl-CoA dioxygenase (PhyH)
MALDDIHPESGPFEYIPGSHVWPLLRGHKVRSFMPRASAKTRSWPKLSESFVVPALENEIVARGAPVKNFHRQARRRPDLARSPAAPRLKAEAAWHDAQGAHLPLYGDQPQTRPAASGA